MAEKITVYQCPACTGPLKFDGTIGKLKCEYCGSTYTTQEIEALYKDKNESAAAADAEAQAKADKAEQAARKEAAESGDAGAASGWGSDAAHMRAYNCTTCGAELLCDETTAATSCPYCGNPTVIPGKFAGVDRPDYVIPFKVDKKQAVNSFKEYYKGRLLLPRSFASDNHIEEIKGVYVPFWMFSGEIDGRAQYEAYKEDKRRVGDEEITRREHYDVFREGSMKFSKIPVDASTKMPNDLMDSIEPFDYRAITEFSLSYMPGFLANKYDVSSKECGKRAGERARKTAEDALRDTVRGYSSVSTAAHEEKIYNEKTEYAVLPVWLLSTKWEGQNFLFAMNGQTGKMIGNLPIARMKLLLISVMTFILSMLVFGSFMIGGEEADTTSYLITAVFAMVLTMIVNAVLIAQMKPVAQEARAAAYISLGGIELSRRNDTYIRTTESRTRIQNAQPRGGGGKEGGGGI